jgi:pyruvate,water dikinase
MPACNGYFYISFDEFLVGFGSRGPNEWKISADTWETDPEIALAALDRIRLQTDDEAPSIRNSNRAAERERIQSASGSPPR